MSLLRGVQSEGQTALFSAHHPASTPQATRPCPETFFLVGSGQEWCCGGELGRCRGWCPGLVGDRELMWQQGRAKGGRQLLEGLRTFQERMIPEGEGLYAQSRTLVFRPCTVAETLGSIINFGFRKPPRSFCFS